jgi:hypothetical protein
MGCGVALRCPLCVGEEEACAINLRPHPIITHAKYLAMQIKIFGKNIIGIMKRRRQSNTAGCKRPTSRKSILDG